MLPTFEQLKHLEADGEDTYKFVGKDVTAEEKQRLIEFDEAYIDLHGKHLITNYEALK